MATLQGKRILLVDDDQDILTSIEAALEGSGATVQAVKDGNSAVRAMADRPDVVVLDMMLPGRSGFLVLERIRSEHPKGQPPKVIMITGNQGKRHQAYAESLGVDMYLNKPFAMEKLIEGIERLCGP